MKKICIDRIDVVVEKSENDNYIIKKHPFLEKEKILDSIDMEKLAIDCLMMNLSIVIH